MAAHEWGSADEAVAGNLDIGGSTSILGALAVAGALAVGVSGQTDPVELALASQHASAKFSLVVDQFDNSEAPHNQVLDVGYNINQVVAGEPVLRISFETNYLTGGVRFMEWHLQYTGADGNPANNRRILTASIRRDTHVTELGVYATVWRLGNADGTIEYWRRESTGRLVANNEAGGPSIFFARATGGNGANRTLFSADQDASPGQAVELLTVRSDVGHGVDTVYEDLGGNWPRWYNGADVYGWLQGGVLRGTVDATSWKFTHAMQLGYVNADLAAIPSISADTNNWSPTNLSILTVVVFTDDGSPHNITGLAGGAQGRIVYLVNAGTATHTLKHESASSTAGNRFRGAGGADRTIAPGEHLLALYINDGTLSRWRLPS